MRRKGLVYIGVVLTIILVGFSIFMIMLISNNKDSGIEKNYGLAYQCSTVNIKDGESNNEGKFDASTVVPNKETLINNLNFIRN